MLSDVDILRFFLISLEITKIFRLKLLSNGDRKALFYLMITFILFYLNLINSVFLSGMERGLILLVAALMVYVAPDVQGTSHLSFSNNTEVGFLSLLSSQYKSLFCLRTTFKFLPAKTSFRIKNKVISLFPFEL